jgi:hypothetical protein
MENHCKKTLAATVMGAILYTIPHPTKNLSRNRSWQTDLFACHKGHPQRNEGVTQVCSEVRALADTALKN